MRCWLLAAAIVSGTSAAAAPPLAAFGQLPSISDLELSPDGRRYGVVTGGEFGRQVQVRETGTNKFVAGFKADPVKVRALRWAGPDHLLVVTSAAASVIGLTGPKREWSMLTAYSLKENRWTRLLDRQDKTMNVISGTPTALMLGGKPVVFAPGIYFPTGRACRRCSASTSTTAGPSGSRPARPRRSNGWSTMPGARSPAPTTPRRRANGR